MTTSKKDFKKSTAKVAAVVQAEDAIASTAPTQPAKAAKLMSKTVKAQAKPAKSASKAAGTKAAKTSAKPLAAKPVAAKPKTTQKTAPKAKKELELTKASSETAQILDSQIAYEGPLFRVLRDHLIEPGGRESHRDVIRHNGSVVILAVDPGKKKKDPWVVVE